MKNLMLAAVLTGCAALLYSQALPNSPVFLEKPYLQLGDSPKLQKHESLALLWHTEDAPASFTVEVKTSADKDWRVMAAPAVQAVEAPLIPRHLVYRAKMTGLLPGEDFQYRVVKSGKAVFTATGRARKSSSQPFRFALFGDCGADTPGERAIAYQASKTDPDFVFIPGDIVYSAGRISEYRTKFFPVYAAATASPETGAPLL